jgi:hypothetical protein
VPQLELVDQTWIAAAPEVVASVVADPRRQADWWPDGPLLVDEDRGREGVRWRIGPGERMAGGVEIWLAPAAGGVVLHYLVRADPATGVWSPRQLARESDRLRRWVKRSFWALKDELEPARAAEPGG